MKENVVAVIAATPVPAYAVPDGGPVPGPRNSSLVTKKTIVTADSLLKSTARFFFADNRNLSGKNEPHFPNYICSADNNLINGVRIVV